MAPTGWGRGYSDGARAFRLPAAHDPPEGACPRAPPSGGGDAPEITGPTVPPFAGRCCRSGPGGTVPTGIPVQLSLNRRGTRVPCHSGADAGSCSHRGIASYKPAWPCCPGSSCMPAGTQRHTYRSHNRRRRHMQSRSRPHPERHRAPPAPRQKCRHRARPPCACGIRWRSPSRPQSPCRPLPPGNPGFPQSRHSVRSGSTCSPRRRDPWSWTRTTR